MKVSRFAVVFATSLCIATVAFSQDAATGPNGKAIVSTSQVSAIVTKIDQESRVVTLKADDGEEYSFVADPTVKNLNQLKKGDAVTATYTEALAYEVFKGGPTGAAAAVAGGAAKSDTKSAGAILGAITVAVTIDGIDTNVPSVTFKEASGELRTLKVKSADKLEGVEVGDVVQITYVEAVALKIDKAPKKK
jgi:hypothetical protein